jgi:ankyrin repeat protein
MFTKIILKSPIRYFSKTYNIYEKPKITPIVTIHYKHCYSFNENHYYKTHIDHLCSKEKSDETLFWNAIKSGTVKNVRYVLDNTRVDPREQNNYAIKYAINKGHWNIVTYLLKNNRILLKNYYIFNSNFLVMAAKAGQKKIVKLLLKECECDPIEILNALNGAIINGHINIFKLLMKDTKLKIETKRNINNPLFMATMNGQVVIVKQLLKDSRFGATVHKKNVMIDAINHKQIEIVKLMLNRIDYNIFEEAVIIACSRKDRLEIAKMLLRHYRTNLEYLQ